MNRTPGISVLAVALLSAACGGGSGGSGKGVVPGASPSAAPGASSSASSTAAPSSSGGDNSSTVAEKICSAVAPADLTAVLQDTPAGAPTDVQGGHGCLWEAASGGVALVAVVYDTPADLPTGAGAAKSVAASVGLASGLYQSSNLTTTADPKPVAVLVLSSLSGAPPSSSTLRSISDAAVAATT